MGKKSQTKINVNLGDREVNPTVSVIMSTYNRAERFLPLAIESVIKQKYQDWELIICDDGSTDDTEGLVKSYSDKEKRIKYIKLDHFGKDTRPKNTGIKAARGKYIAYIDDDCEYYPHHLEVLVQSIEDLECDLVYSDMMIYNEDVPNEPPVAAISHEFDPQYLINKNFIDTSMVLHNREAIFRVGGWDESLPRFVDWNLWMRMAKAGMDLKRVALVTVKYKYHENNSAKAYPVRSWRDPRFGILLEPTFDPVACYINLPYLEGTVEGDYYAGVYKNPKVAIFTITYDRWEYTTRMLRSLDSSTKVPFTWYVWDNGSKDDTVEKLNWMKDLQANWVKFVHFNEENIGITKASNGLIDAIGSKADIIIKVDNDCEFLTEGWLEDFIDLWRRNNMLYMSPYPEGLVNNPGGAPRIGHAMMGPYLTEVTRHIGGLCAFIDARAYSIFRWTDRFKHGNQDTEASTAFRKMSFQPCYIPTHRIAHMDGTEKQHEKYPEYFKRRIKEKTEVVE